MSKIELLEIKAVTEHRYLLHIKIDESVQKLSVMSDTLLRMQMFKPRVLNEEEYHELKEYSVIDELKDKAVYFISFQPRLTSEVVVFLKKKEATNQQINRLIDQFVENGLLNDQEYVAMAVHQAVEYESDGPYKVKEKLLKKGADRQLVEEALRSYDEQTQRRKLSDLMDKELRHPFKKPLIKVLLMLKQRFMTKGYSVHVVDQVVEMYKEDLAKLIDEEYLIDQVLKSLPKSMFEKKNHQKLKAKLMRLGYSYELIQQKIKGGHD